LGEKLSPKQDVAERVVGDRFRLEIDLGRGGMARVFRALDERTGSHVALKQLTPGGDRPEAARAMLEHEYHTLVQLAHPHIVRAFDYGLDPAGAFYTMELLDGADARETTRNRSLTVEQICLLIHDTASALALVHSRRLLHRDVSPRNLFCGSDGRARLIDFGSLAPMGVAAVSAGTPPFVSPEVVHMQSLDARSDLYALGALAYYMLTRRNAYPARQVRELRELWQLRPDAPHVLRDDTPRALSDLVMALLSLDPRGRPSSAAEVCERLRAIYALPVENERQLAQAFLSTSSLVGREIEHAQARARLMRLRRGRGGTLVITGDGGVGRTRVLASIVLDAKLMGTSTVLIDANNADEMPYGLAAQIAEAVADTMAVRLLPEVTRKTLATLSPALRRKLLLDTDLQPGAAPSKRAIEEAWLSLLRAAGVEQPLLIAIDDVHRGDGASLSVLGQLSGMARELRVLLAVTSTNNLATGQTVALAQLVKPEERISLGPLDADATRQLLGSLFGNVAGLDEAARFIFEVSQGNPSVCMQYAQYLVDEGIARYDDGAWNLPGGLRNHALPSSLSGMLEKRVSVLSEHAFQLALALALARDETRAEWQRERRVHFEDLGKVLGGLAAPAFGALDELLRAGLIEQRDRDYVLGQGAIADAILRLADDGARTRAHRRLAEVFQEGSYRDAYLVALHMQQAGDFEQSQGLLLETLAAGTPDWSWQSMRLSLTARIAQRQLEWWLAQPAGSPREGFALRRLVLNSCSVTDWSASRVGDALLDQVIADLGLAHWQAAGSDLSDAERLAFCMARARQAQLDLPEEQRVLTPESAASTLVAIALPLSGAYVNSGDVPRARRLAEALERVRSLSPLQDLLAELCSIAVDRVTGRYIGGRIAEQIPRLNAATQIPDVMRLGAIAVYLHIQAIEDARYGRKRALELMDVLASSVGDSMFIVVHARYMAHAFAGRAQVARRLRKQLELTTADDVWRRYAYVFVEAQLHALSGNLSELNATTATVARLVTKFEGWTPYLSYCRAHTHRLLGELGVAEKLLAEALAAIAPGEHRAYPMLALSHAEALLLQGRLPEALAESIVLAAHARDKCLDQAALVSALRLQALVHSALGDHVEARERLREAFSVARALEYGGLPLAVLYEAQARLAVAENDPAAGIAALTVLREHLEQADAPALFGAYEHLRIENARQMHGSMHPPGEGPEPIPSLPVVSQIHSTSSTIPSDMASSSSATSSSSEADDSEPTVVRYERSGRPTLGHRKR
jgi:hypothetical protein